MRCSKGTLAIALAIAVLASPRRAIACDCPAADAPEIALVKAPVVVLARVVRIDDAGPAKSGRLVTELEVVRAWRGAAAGDRIAVRGTGGDCSYFFDAPAGVRAR